LNVWLNEMLDGIHHNVYEVANANRLFQKCIIQKAIVVEDDRHISDWSKLSQSKAVVECRVLNELSAYETMESSSLT
jgi:peptidyl-tRNA hydrolase